MRGQPAGLIEYLRVSRANRSNRSRPVQLSGRLLFAAPILVSFLLPLGQGWRGENSYGEWELGYSTAQILGSSFSSTPLLTYAQRQVRTRDVLLSGTVMPVADDFPTVNQPWIGVKARYGGDQYIGMHWNAMFLSKGSPVTGDWNFSSLTAAFWKLDTYPGGSALVATQRTVSGYRGHDAGLHYGRQWAATRYQSLFAELGPGYYRESLSVQSLPLVGSSPGISPAEFVLESWNLFLRLGSRWEYEASRVEMNLKFSYGPLAELRTRGLYSGEFNRQFTGFAHRSDGQGSYQEIMAEMKIGFSLTAVGFSQNVEMLFGLQIVSRDLNLSSVNNDYLVLPGSSNTTLLTVLLGDRLGQTGQAWSGNQGRLQISFRGRF